LILDKADFDSKISLFFKDYLVDRKTKYLWNNFSSPFFCANIDIGQGSALSPILLALYLSSIFYIFEKRVKNLKILISIISFVDNGLFISQNKCLTISKFHLFCSYHIISSLFEQFSLIIKHRKIKTFIFLGHMESSTLLHSILLL